MLKCVAKKVWGNTEATERGHLEIKGLEEEEESEEAEELNMKCNFKEQEERDGQEEQIETIIEQ